MAQLSSPFDLSKDEVKTLAELAIAAKQKAYCPYSSFQVGASLLLSTGTYSTGANVEIASTPVGICAERCAIAPIIASVTRPFPPDPSHANIPIIRAVAVATNIDPPASPCGMCRQFMREFLDKDVKIWMYGKYGYVDDEADAQAEVKANGGKRVNGAVVLTMDELLPMSFGPNDMQKNEQKFRGTSGS
ncbi:hypothetical protein DV737_g1557, partial [Chaetothyriales sp. CBS 132003]